MGRGVYRSPACSPLGTAPARPLAPEIPDPAVDHKVLDQGLSANRGRRKKPPQSFFPLPSTLRVWQRNSFNKKIGKQGTKKFTKYIVKRTLWQVMGGARHFARSASSAFSAQTTPSPAHLFFLRMRVPLAHPPSDIFSLGIPPPSIIFFSIDRHLTPQPHSTHFYDLWGSTGAFLSGQVHRLRWSKAHGPPFPWRRWEGAGPDRTPRPREAEAMTIVSSGVRAYEFSPNKLNTKKNTCALWKRLVCSSTNPTHLLVSEIVHPSCVI